MNPGQIRGMLLEEAVLHLLRRSGYRTVDSRGTDPTLGNVGAGLAVKGRGSEHQIDAIADFLVHQPFSNPQRLMVEAKCYGPHYPVGIEVVRNAIGVLKDVSEFWVPGPGTISGCKRYHYQYAIFSASAFTSGSQKYAFAQDIHLFPLNRSEFFRPILNAIRGIRTTRFLLKRPATQSTGQMSQFRALARKLLRDEQTLNKNPKIFETNEIDILPYVAACHRLNYALVAMLGGRFPVLLSPSETARSFMVEDEVYVRIFWDAQGWYIRDQQNRNLFSFDLPEDLFELYAEEGFLSAKSALNMKEQMMSHIQAIETNHGRTRIINFVLDRNWVSRIRDKING